MLPMSLPSHSLGIEEKLLGVKVCGSANVEGLVVITNITEGRRAGDWG